MIKGKKVVMNDKYYVSEKNKGKIFEVTSEPYSVCGTVVVKKRLRLRRESHKQRAATSGSSISRTVEARNESSKGLYFR